STETICQHDAQEQTKYSTSHTKLHAYLTEPISFEIDRFVQRCPYCLLLTRQVTSGNSLLSEEYEKSAAQSDDCKRPASLVRNHTNRTTARVLRQCYRPIGEMLNSRRPDF